MNCYTCLSAKPVRTGEPERFVFLRCKLAGDRTTMAFPEAIEKNMTQAEAPDWCPRINHEVQ